MWVDIPYESHDLLMDVTDVLQCDVALGVVAGRLDAFAVDPVGGVSVALYLHVFAELLGADSAALLE